MYPNFKNKHAEDPLFSPSDYVDYRRKLGKDFPHDLPDGIILCYHRTLTDHIRRTHHVKEVRGFPHLLLVEEDGGSVGVVGNFGVGAPVAVIYLEELIALGVKRFVSIGTAGTLQKHMKVGDLVVCDRAIRDEGTSHHYLKKSKYARASREMTKLLCSELDAGGTPYSVGTSWTIDAPYRESVSEARHYQSEGVLTVEMEASALFAVAQYRGVEMGAMFTISDSLAELEWKPQFHAKHTRKGLETLFRVARSTLLAK